MMKQNNNNKSDLKASEKKKITHFTKKTENNWICFLHYYNSYNSFFATGNLRQYNK